MSIPTRAVMPFACWPNQLPEGWLPCHGQAVLRADYPELFAMLGTTFGPGDGADNFLLPDLRGRTIVGAALGGSGSGYAGSMRTPGESGGQEHVHLTAAQMPLHSHGIGMQAEGQVIPGNFDFALGGPQTFGFHSVGPAGNSLPSDGRTSAAGGGAPHTNMPPFLVLTWAIKA